jgi:uncharacterized membrane-anchored protein YhcB (DUF1043 family)
MPSNFSGWVIAGAGLVIGIFVAELALKMLGQGVSIRS